MKPRKKHLMDVTVGGFMLGAAAVGKPYDFGNIILLGLGLLWVFAGWISILSTDR